MGKVKRVSGASETTLCFSPQDMKSKPESNPGGEDGEDGTTIKDLKDLKDVKSQI